MISYVKCPEPVRVHGLPQHTRILRLTKNALAIFTNSIVEWQFYFLKLIVTLKFKCYTATSKLQSCALYGSYFDILQFEYIFFRFPCVCMPKSIILYCVKLAVIQNWFVSQFEWCFWTICLIIPYFGCYILSSLIDPLKFWMQNDFSILNTDLKYFT